MSILQRLPFPVKEYFCNLDIEFELSDKRLCFKSPELDSAVPSSSDSHLVQAINAQTTDSAGMGCKKQTQLLNLWDI